MKKYGESYASLFYILAALILAIAGGGLGKSFDMVAGIFYFACDISILVLQCFKRFQRIRSLLLFGGSFLGSLILVAGGIFDDLHNAQTFMEWLGAIIRFISNIILVVASFSGLLTLYPKIKSKLPEKPGKIYMLSYVLFFIFAIIQFGYEPSLMSSGYILATVLWVLASNAIRLKYDEGTKTA